MQCTPTHCLQPCLFVIQLSVLSVISMWLVTSVVARDAAVVWKPTSEVNLLVATDPADPRL